MFPVFKSIPSMGSAHEKPLTPSYANENDYDEIVNTVEE